MIEVIRNIMIRIIMVLEFAWKYKVGTVIILLCFWDSIGVFLVNTISQAIFNILLEIIKALSSTIS